MPVIQLQQAPLGRRRSPASEAAQEPALAPGWLYGVMTWICDSRDAGRPGSAPRACSSSRQACRMSIRRSWCRTAVSRPVPQQRNVVVVEVVCEVGPNVPAGAVERRQRGRVAAADGVHRVDRRIAMRARRLTAAMQRGVESVGVGDDVDRTAAVRDVRSVARNPISRSSSPRNIAPADGDQHRRRCVAG